MHQNVTDLSPEQLQAIELYISGEAPCNIAQTLGISRQTLWRWRQLPAFEQAQRECRAERYSRRHELIDDIIEHSLAALLAEVKPLETSHRNRLETVVAVLKIFKAMPPPDSTSLTTNKCTCRKCCASHPCLE